MGSTRRKEISEDDKAFGRHVKALRGARKMTQEKLAERGGLAADTIRRLEKGTFSPSLTTLRALCTGFDLTMASLFESHELLDLTTPAALASKVRAIPAEMRTPVLSLLSVVVELVEEVGAE